MWIHLNITCEKTRYSLQELESLLYIFLHWKSRWSATHKDNSRANSPVKWDGSLAVGTYIYLQRGSAPAPSWDVEPTKPTQE